MWTAVRLQRTWKAGLRCLLVIEELLKFLSIKNDIMRANFRDINSGEV